jgi:TolB protein
MRKTLLLFLMIYVSNVYGQGKSYDYCYTNGKGICVYSIADKMEHLIVKKGSDPCISPDGTKVAYTTYSTTGDRTIAVIDLNTKQKTILNTNSNNCYGPIWSPDGQYIAYNVFDAQKSNWSVAVIDAANTSFKVLTGQLEQCYMPSWLADSKSVVVQNMDTVFVFDLAGNEVTTYKVSDMGRGVPVLEKDAEPSSSDRFVFTKDNKKVVFSSEANEPGGSDGPPTVVFVYDTDSKLAIRLSPKGYFAGGVCVKGNHVLFTASKLKSNVQNVYTVDLDGKNFKVLFANCADISAKN